MNREQKERLIEKIEFLYMVEEASNDKFALEYTERF